MDLNESLIELSPQNFIQFLRQNDIKRFYFVYDSKQNKLITSHPQLVPVAKFIEVDKRDFNFHEGLFFQLAENSDTLLGAFIHRTNRGQAAGGVRYWNYNTMEDYFRDGLRLSKGMTHKNALANLWWGGGKGVITSSPSVDKKDKEVREAIYKMYGGFMSSLNGCYVTAEDVGTNVSDMANVFSQTRFTTCIPFKLGGSGNPSIPTARGVVAGIEAALHHLNNDGLDGKTVTVQGAGNVGRPLIKFLFEKNISKAIVHDISNENIEKLKKELPGKNIETKVVEIFDDSILKIECDVFAPCATGAVLNADTIPQIKAKVVCGAANNQLEDAERDDKLLKEHGILYIPDFLTNRMGIVNCANEQYGYVNDDPYIEQHLDKEWKHSIYNTALNVIQKSSENDSTPGKIALDLAEELSMIDHPVFGHRGKLIIKSLVDNNWIRK